VQNADRGNFTMGLLVHQESAKLFIFKCTFVPICTPGVGVVCKQLKLMTPHFNFFILTLQRRKVKEKHSIFFVTDLMW
jgi:hypothetical protein